MVCANRLISGHRRVPRRAAFGLNRKEAPEGVPPGALFDRALGAEPDLSPRQVGGGPAAAYRNLSLPDGPTLTSVNAAEDPRSPHLLSRMSDRH
jgi:hypothetical protein